MQIAPLSLITKSAQSPNRVIKHNDSLIFSITSQKFNSRKQTLLLQESKQMHNTTEQHGLRDYFKIHNKIKCLQEKVENIKTNYCESQRNSPLNFYKDKENRHDIINLQFPEEIYERKAFVNNDDHSEVGKIKRKKSKYYTGIQQKTRQKSRSNSKNQESIVSTKRNNLTTYNIKDFSVYREKNSSFRHNQTGMDFKNQSRERSSSFSLRKKQNNFIDGNKITEIKKMRQQLQCNRLSNERLSKKSRQSQRRLSINKDQTRRLKQQNSALQKQLILLKQKLKKSDNIKEKQKQTMQKQKEQIEELKMFLEELLRRNNQKNVEEMIIAHEKEGGGKITKLRLLR